jgi:3',5'-cyclic AMP phosphodiesterase CpdA
MKKLLLISLIPLLFACSSNKEVQQTTTDPAPVTAIPEPVILASVGDISCIPSQLESGDYPCADDKVAELIKYNNPDYFIPLGDLQYNTATYELLTTVYDPVWGFIKSRSIPVLGNHDYPAEGILSYFPELPTEGYYSKSLNEDWYVLVLNTNDDCQFVSCDSQSEQYNWLIRTLDANPGKCAIVAMHHPRFSSGVHGNNDYLEDIWQVLISREVPLVL